MQLFLTVSPSHAFLLTCSEIIQAGDGEPDYIGRIVEFFETIDKQLYFTAQWFFRAEDTVSNFGTGNSLPLLKFNIIRTAHQLFHYIFLAFRLSRSLLMTLKQFMTLEEFFCRRRKMTMYWTALFPRLELFKWNQM